MEHTDKERVDLLKGYLHRLNEGEALDSVRADFVDKFKEVDAFEILKAEQEMMESGLPVAEVKKLCDVHSALFHGNTREERAALTKMYTQEVGHPLYTFTKENEALEALLARAKEAIANGMVNHELVSNLREIAIHYAKKGDLLYPHLDVKYGISGPSDVMWTVDDEIRDELAVLDKAKSFGEKELEKFKNVVARAEEMIYKEEKILFPNCAANFTREEWVGIYHDSKDYPDCLGVKPETWMLAEKAKFVVEGATPEEQEIVMAGGHITVAQLTAMLNTIPLEITFVDDNNINRFFNEGPKDFKRPGMAIDREVFSCHPPKIEAKVRWILDEFRAGTLDKVPVWMEKNGKTMLVTYLAVRDKGGNYIGTLELVQNMEFAKEHFQVSK